ncbi:ubiquinone biosynthesis methyltransferase UbiE [Rhizobiales bacterium]|uniref:ubiquinone biosynthesis methyltransferase UbiE n=1 Tax=Ensifer canadensis TaxID=555315 RepID=UPI000DE272AF
MDVGNSVPAEAIFEPLLQFEMEMGTFLSEWQHCDHLSSYLARMISHNRTDPVRHSNFFSSALNELLEVSFRSGAASGHIGLAIYRHGPIERVQITFPCPSEQVPFYREAVSKVDRSDAHARYLDSISTDMAPSRESILLDLAINFDASIRIEESTLHAVTLIVDLPLEGLVS